jgi:uncharacterized phage protein (TIGR01671 family)
MNREILFRGKRLDNSEWVEGGYFQEPYTSKAYIICWNSTGMGYNEFIEVGPSTVGQYTGLKDRNGKRIFEGDVLFDPHPSIKKYYTVIWEGGTLYRRTSNSHYLSLTVLNSGYFEVVGNIHDNPELVREPQP